MNKITKEALLEFSDSIKSIKDISAKDALEYAGLTKSLTAKEAKELAEKHNIYYDFKNKEFKKININKESVDACKELNKLNASVIIFVDGI